MTYHLARNDTQDYYHSKILRALSYSDGPPGAEELKLKIMLMTQL
jgi:hypothetical protein